MRQRLSFLMLLALCGALTLLPNVACAGLFSSGEDEIDFKSSAPEAATVILGIRFQYEGLVTVYLRHVESGKVGRVMMNHAPWPFGAASDYGKVAFGEVRVLRMAPGHFELINVEVSRATTTPVRLDVRAPWTSGVNFTLDAGECAYVGNLEVRPSSGRNMLSGLHISIADWQALDLAIARTKPEGAALPADIHKLVPREFVQQPGRLTVGREVSASLVRKYLPQYADAVPEVPLSSHDVTGGTGQGAFDDLAK